MTEKEFLERSPEVREEILNVMASEHMENYRWGT